jgi:hypothetical protein
MVKRAAGDAEDLADVVAGLAGIRLWQFFHKRFFL